MPVYQYKVASRAGSSQGFVTADTAAEGRSRLRQQGLCVVSFTECSTSKVSWMPLALPVLPKASMHHAINEFTHYLVMLLRAGVPLSEALGVLVRQAPRRLEPVLRRIAERVIGGDDFGQAISEEPSVFDSTFVGVVRVGQASGMLEQCLQRLVSLRRRRLQLRQRVQAALAYPLIVVAVGFGVVTFLLTFVVPRITSLLLQSGRQLPLPTRLLLAITGGIQNYWWMALIIVTMGFILVRLLDRERRLYRWISRALLRIPIMGSLAMKSGIAQSCALLETMLKSGMPLDEAMALTSKSTHNPILREEFNRMLLALRSGRPLVETSDTSSALPPVVLHVLAVGEQTGQLEDMLGELAQTYNADVDVAARQAVSILEPALIVIISAIVGFIVLAVILPIIRISGSF